MLIPIFSLFLLVIHNINPSHQEIFLKRIFLESCAAATIGSHCCTYCIVVSLFLQKIFRYRSAFFLTFQCKQKIGHSCIRTSISLCHMSPVNHSHLTVLSNDHVARIKISVTDLVMLRHTFQSCHQFISCRRIQDF